MGFIQNIQDFLGVSFRKSHLKGNLFDSVGRNWRQLDADQVWNASRFGEMAEKNGSNNIPEPEATSFDGGESAIVSQIKGMIEHLVSEYRADISAADIKIQSLELDRVEDHFDQTVSTFEKEVTKLERDLDADINPLSERALNLEGKVNRIQNQYETVEPPRNFDKPDRDYWTKTGWVVMAQAFVSAIFYSDASPTGFVGGAGVALLISALDVSIVSLLAIGTTKSVLRTKDLPFPPIRAFGFLCIVVILPYIFFINLAFAHTREILSELVVLNGFFPVTVADLANRLWPIDLPSLGLEQLLSIILFVFTSLTSLFQAWNTRNHFEPIPEYKKTYRELVKTKQRIRKRITTTIDTVNQLHEKAQTTIERELFMDPIKALEGFARHKKIAVENCQSCIEHLVPIGVALIERYRDVNKQHRTKPAPPHFDIPWSYTPPELPVDEHESDMRVVERYKSQSLDLIETQRERLERLDKIRTTHVRRYTNSLKMLNS